MKIKRENWNRVMYNLVIYKNRFRAKGFDEKLVDYLYNCLKEENRLVEINRCVEEVLSGRPIQYVVGNVNFYGNKILVNENVLIPRFETELLVEKSIKYINKFFDGKVSVLEIGTGSGCIAITLKKEIDCDIVGTDISNLALEVAGENADNNKVNIEFINSDVFSKIEGKFDVIISNPPYIGYEEEIMDIVRDNEPKIALYASDNGLYYYQKILFDCWRYLKNKFLICFEIGWKQGEDIKRLVYKYLGDVNVSVECDYNGRDRFVFIWN